MSSPKSTPIPATPLRAARFQSATPGGSSISTRAQCSDNLDDFSIVKIHTAKCSICDKRNTTDQMRRCKGCTWQICRPCQIQREENGRSLTHGNSMTATPSASTARRRILHPVGALAETKDPQAEAALAKVKQEMAEEAPLKKKIGKSTVGAQEVITPPSSNERTKLGRKAKKNKVLAEVKTESDDEEVLVRDQLSPFGGAGSKRRLNFKDASSANEGFPNKRARMERMKAPTPLPAEWDMTLQEKANLQKKTYTNLADVNGIRPSHHPTVMKDKFSVDVVSGPGNQGTQAWGQPGLYSSATIPHDRQVLIPKTISRNGKPRKSGDELVAEIQDKVRIKLHERHGWTYFGAPPAITSTTPDELPVREPREGTLRDLVDDEMRTLHHNLILDEDQQNELVAAVKGAARKWGNDIVKSMPAGFRAMAKSGLDLALEHLTYGQQQRVVALVQMQAGNKLKEFEAEGTPSSDAQAVNGLENVGGI
ncbi:hypothetical protein PMIN06_011340 [Paraphaeosphaeria minitans]|uniref:Uncharacterized protein n=1 Tax=Paraphaeosphaeria minitans TaxID=565426 RepID=A0A9P6G6S7_9PLEO|nr:hypothetical protein PMIN01_12525 [Paraphaeosphaeria minitans]